MRPNGLVLCWSLLGWSLPVPLPLFGLFTVLEVLGLPIRRYVFYISLDERCRDWTTDLLGLPRGRGMEVWPALINAEVQFLLIGLFICLTIRLARLVREKRD